MAFQKSQYTVSKYMAIFGVIIVFFSLDFMGKHNDKYDEYVEHPRYGRGPRYTGLNPKEEITLGIYLGWNSTPEQRIPDTAIIADIELQVSCPLPITHYFDVKRKCRDCDRLFIFFAIEQKYWYETLGFPLESDCRRCIDCRKSQQKIAQLRKRYEEMRLMEERTEKQNLELADCALTLIEQSVFGDRALKKVRTILNSIPVDSQTRFQVMFCGLRDRVEHLSIHKPK